MSNVYNPAVIYEEGRFYMYERTAGLWIYYGCCDTATGLGTVPLDDLIPLPIDRSQAGAPDPF